MEKTLRTSARTEFCIVYWLIVGISFNQRDMCVTLAYKREWGYWWSRV